MSDFQDFSDTVCYAVLTVVSGNKIRGGQTGRRCVFHSNAVSHIGQHVSVIVSVTESGDLLRGESQKFRYIPDAGVLSRVPMGEFQQLVDDNIQKELDLYDLLRQKISGPVDIEELTSEFIRASGVRSEKMVVQDYVRRTAQVRIYALVHAGEYALKKNLIVPV